MYMTCLVSIESAQNSSITMENKIEYLGEFNSLLLVDLSYLGKRRSMRNRSRETSCWPIMRSGSSQFTAWYCSTNGSCSKKFKWNQKIKFAGTWKSFQWIRTKYCIGDCVMCLGQISYQVSCKKTTCKWDTSRLNISQYTNYLFTIINIFIILFCFF